MIPRKLALVAGLWSLAAGIAWAGCGGDGGGQGCGGGTSVPAWAAVANQALPPVDARLLKGVTHRFFDLLGSGRKDAAYGLLAPEAVHALGDWADPKHRQVVRIESIGEPQMESPDWAAVESAVTWRELDPGPSQGKSSAQHGTFLFRLDDSKHLIRFRSAGGPVLCELPATAAVVTPWWTQPNLKSSDPKWPEMVARTDASFSRRWSGWDADPQKLMSNIQGWWAEQAKAYGTFVRVTQPPRFVAMSGDSAVVEASQLLDAGDSGGANATYRYRLVQDLATQDSPLLKEHLQWRIADICLVRVQKIPARQMAGLAGGGSAAGGASGCGCGSGGGTAPAPPPKAAQGQSGCGGSGTGTSCGSR